MVEHEDFGLFDDLERETRYDEFYSWIVYGMSRLQWGSNPYHALLNLIFTGISLKLIDDHRIYCDVRGLPKEDFDEQAYCPEKRFERSEEDRYVIDKFYETFYERLFFRLRDSCKSNYVLKYDDLSGILNEYSAIIYKVNGPTLKSKLIPYELNVIMEENLFTTLDLIVEINNLIFRFKIDDRGRIKNIFLTEFMDPYNLMFETDPTRIRSFIVGNLISSYSETYQNPVSKFMEVDKKQHFSRKLS